MNTRGCFLHFLNSEPPKRIGTPRNAEVCVLLSLVIAKWKLFSNGYFMSESAKLTLPIWLKPHEIKGKAGTLLSLYVQPGASRTVIKGIYQDRLKLSVQAPPVEGAANTAVIEFLSKALAIAKNKIHLVSGETSRMKNVWIEDANSSKIHDNLS